MEWNTTVEACIRSKDFDALTEEERQQVLACLSQEEYEQYRALAKAGKSLGDSPIPPSSIHENLQQAFRKRYRRRNLPLPTIAMPLWQAAAVAALFLLLGKVVTWAPVHATPSVAVQMRDSLWLERVSQAMKDTAVAMLKPFDNSALAPAPRRLAFLQDSMAHVARDEEARGLLPEPAVDTPDWARRSTQIDQAYINHLYRIN
ncbi:MAG TPA: hypothetical protein VJ933_09655 [Phaeodactylibacter sp.]|nr:hypothetical protein [Phaeodactylibacter sp.]